MFGDQEPDGPEYIFGNTAPMPDDVVPTASKPVRYRPFKRVETSGDHRRFSRETAKHTNRKTNPLPFAVKAPSPIRQPEPENDYHTFTEIPDGDGPRRHPLFGINPDIVFNDEASPERDAEGRFNIENLVTYSQEDLDKVTSASNETTAAVQDKMLREGAALLMSYDDASSNVEAILRDGLGITVEIDASVSEVISHMMRLNMISEYMDRMSLPEPIKSRFMRVLTEKLAEDAHTSINKALTSEKYNSVLKNLQARMKGGSEENPAPAAQPDLAGQLGVVRKRSSGGGVSPPTSDKVDDQHAFNERQDAGVRTDNL
tara:strand:+ start:13459 stop:14406 length:948 start_codon:yes stop_codon:yes gene_type:complete